MIGEQAVREILSQYERFGWRLRKVLLTEATRRSLDPEIFASCEIITAGVDAAWFTRTSKNGNMTWELRALDAFPFALVEVIDPDIQQPELDAVLKKLELQLQERLKNQARAH